MNKRTIKPKKRSLTFLKTGSILTVVVLFGSMTAVIGIWRNSSDTSLSHVSAPEYSANAMSYNIQNSSNVNNSTLVTVSINSRSPNVRIPCPGCSGGGSTYMTGEISFNQKDMPVPDILLFYVEVF